MKRLLLCAALLCGGCSSWRNGKPLDAIPMPADPTQRLEVWSKGEKWELHALRIDGDTLRGVRWWHDPACDSCQVALPASAVDSVRTSSYDGGETGALTLFVLPFVVLGMLFIILSSGGSGS